MFLEVIFEVVIVFDPDLSFQCPQQAASTVPSNSLYGPRNRPAGRPCVFLSVRPLFSRINHYLYVVGVRGDLSGLPLFYFRKIRSSFSGNSYLCHSKFRYIFGFPPQRPYRPVYGISDNRGVWLFSPAAPPPVLAVSI